MRTTLDNKVTLPQKIIDDLGIISGKSEIEFLQENGRWYLVLANPKTNKPERFRTVYQIAKITLSSEKIMALTRNLDMLE